MRVLITGATGFLGDYVVSEFADNGYEVTAMGRNEAKLQRLAGPKVTPLQASLADLDSLSLAVDVVVHAAALSTIWGPWQDFYHTNVGGTRSVVEFCRRNGVPRLVFISSPSVYSGRGDRLNIREHDFDPENRLNNYIRSKIMAEQEARQFSGSVILRPRGLIGVGDTSIVPRLLHANDTIGIPLFRPAGRNVIDLTCVENVAYAARLAAEAPDAAGRTYNITNDDPRSLKSILDQVFAQLGQVPRYRRRKASVLYGVASILETAYRLFRLPGEPILTRYLVYTLAYSQVLDISAAKRDLGYAPIVSLDEGIARYVESLD